MVWGCLLPMLYRVRRCTYSWLCCMQCRQVCLWVPSEWVGLREAAICRGKHACGSTRQGRASSQQPYTRVSIPIAICRVKHACGSTRQGRASPQQHYTRVRQRCRDGALYMYLPSLFIIPTLFVYFLVCHIPTFFTFLMFYSLVHTDNNLTTKWLLREVFPKGVSIESKKQCNV